MVVCCSESTPLSFDSLAIFFNGFITRFPRLLLSSIAFLMDTSNHYRLHVFMVNVFRLSGLTVSRTLHLVDRIKLSFVLGLPHSAVHLPHQLYIFSRLCSLRLLAFSMATGGHRFTFLFKRSRSSSIIGGSKTEIFFRDDIRNRDGKGS